MINLHVWVNIATIWLLGPSGHNATVDTIYDADYPGYTHTYSLQTHTHSKTKITYTLREAVKNYLADFFR